MALADLLPAVRALPRAEQVELLRLLEREVGDAVARVTASIPPGTMFDTWKPDLDPESEATVERFVASIPRHQ